MDNKVIAVDFDGTITKQDNFPHVTEPNMDIIKFIQAEKKKGATIILWTCRVGEDLENAVEYCKKHNVPIDYVNENAPERIAKYGNDSRKIGADIYLDDKSLCLKEINNLDRRMFMKMSEEFLRDLKKEMENVDCFAYNLRSPNVQKAIQYGMLWLIVKEMEEEKQEAIKGIEDHIKDELMGAEQYWKIYQETKEKAYLTLASDESRHANFFIKKAKETNTLKSLPTYENWHAQILTRIEKAKEE